MGRRCRTCAHQKRAEIEKDLLSDNVTYRDIAAKFGLSHMSVSRHLENGHIAKDLIRASEIKKVAYSENLLDKLMYLQHESLKILVEAKNPADGKPLLNTALNAIGKAATMLETQGKLGGQLKDLEVNIAVNSHWLSIKQEIFATLKTFPDALRAMQEAVAKGNLSDLEKGLLEPEPGDYEERLSPEILKIINREFGEEQIESQNQEYRRVLDKPPKKTKPDPGKRIRYRCTRPHSWHGKYWAMGQVWDSSNPDGPEPPAGSDDWEIYNPDEKFDCLQPTRR